MNIKRFVAFALILCLALSLCACSDGAANGGETTGSTAASTQDTTEQLDDGKVTYTVAVIDEDGNPVVGAAVQICKDSCLPGMTNEEGIAKFNVLEDDYKVSFMAMPEGYEAEAEEFYFEDGAYELTIVLKAVA